MSEQDDKDRILTLALYALTSNFDAFIGECMDENGKPKAPSPRALAQARACLPEQHEHAFKKVTP